MADEFDPLKQTDTKAPEAIYGKILIYFNTLLRIFMSLIATVRKTTTNTNNNDDDLLRSPFENILKLGVDSMNKPTEEKPTEETYQKLNFTENAYKAPIRSTNPFAEDIQKPSSPANVTQSLPRGNSNTSDDSYWENTADYHGKYSRTFFIVYLFILDR